MKFTTTALLTSTLSLALASPQGYIPSQYSDGQPQVPTTYNQPPPVYSTTTPLYTPPVEQTTYPVSTSTPSVYVPPSTYNTYVSPSPVTYPSVSTLNTPTTYGPPPVVSTSAATYETPTVVYTPTTYAPPTTYVIPTTMSTYASASASIPVAPGNGTSFTSGLPSPSATGIGSGASGRVVGGMLAVVGVVVAVFL